MIQCHKVTKSNFQIESILVGESQKARAIMAFFTDLVEIQYVSLLDENADQRYLANPEITRLYYDKIRGAIFNLSQSHKTIKLYLRKEQVLQFQMNLLDLENLKKFLRTRIPQLNFPEQYKILETIGKGSSGTVVKCRSYDNQTFAAKIVKRSQGLAQREVSICKILAQNPHKNILSMKEYFLSGGEMIIIFPYINGGTLYNYMATTETHDALLSIRKNFRQILKGLEYIHNLGLIHRDIKMDNIMVNKSSFETFIIIDFGLATFYNSVNLMEDRCGTIGYIAPEVLNNEQYDQRCDIFSLAQVFHILLTGNPMFNRELGQVQITQIIKKQLFQINEQKIENPLIADLLKNMTRNQSERFLTNQCLNHQFLKKQFVWEKLANLKSLKLKSPFQQVN